MSEYEIGKEMKELTTELEHTKALLGQLYAIVEHNVNKKKLEEPPIEQK